MGGGMKAPSMPQPQPMPEIDDKVAESEAKLEAERQNVMNIQKEPYGRLSFISDVLRGVPSTQSTMAITSTPTASPLTQAIGTGIAALGAYKGLK